MATTPILFLNKEGDQANGKCKKQNSKLKNSAHPKINWD